MFQCAKGKYDGRQGLVVSGLCIVGCRRVDRENKWILRRWNAVSRNLGNSR